MTQAQPKFTDYYKDYKHFKSRPNPKSPGFNGADLPSSSASKAPHTLYHAPNHDTISVH